MLDETRETLYDTAVLCSKKSAPYWMVCRMRIDWLQYFIDDLLLSPCDTVHAGYLDFGTQPIFSLTLREINVP